MIDKMLKRVTDAEEQADGIRVEAEKQAAEIVAEARVQAEKLKTEAAQAMKVRHQEYMQWIQEMSKKNNDTGSRLAEEAANQLRQSVESKKSEAVKAILNSIL